MNFSSIREYFYRLYNVCYLLMLMPLAIFLFLYFQIIRSYITPIVRDEMSVWLLAGGGVCVAVINLTIVHLYSLKRLRIYAAEQGLGHKLDRYHEIIFMRFAGSVVACLVMALGLLLTGSQIFGAVFMMILFLMGLQWPTSAKACRALKLKGDEYKMVYTKSEDI